MTANGNTNGSSSTMGQDTTITVAAYPLRRRFFVMVLPVLGAALTGLLIAVALALSASVERAYEADAARRNTLLLSAVATAVPDAFDILVHNRPPNDEMTMRAQDVLNAEVHELALSCAAILTPSGRLAESEKACPALSARDWKVLSAPGATLFREVAGPPLVWMVASVVFSPSGRPVVVVTAQPATVQERAIGWNTLAWVGGLALALTAATGLATLLVVRAQREIDRRTAALAEARTALARFVSLHTRRNALSGKSARRCEATVLFMDIRDFSSFAEAVPPETAAELVTKIAEIGFAAVIETGGDVDRLTGDGLIARFDGKDRTDRAWRAAEAILSRLAAIAPARSVGIGLSDGEVVEATIVAGDRADATILGRTVNLGARLCSAAEGGEIVATAAMRMPPPSVNLVTTEAETLALKGHRAPVSACRYTLMTCKQVVH
ncbi:MAG: adenylate/guanylate cyclase domain-containing protein [Proteobacteria bacterium]|nr:adenylate/guanylate cyclase domain-containing protein [Pseudomonadota bacterium]